MNPSIPLVPAEFLLQVASAHEYNMPTFAEATHKLINATLRKKTRLTCIRRFLLHQSVLGTRWFDVRGALAVAARRRGRYRVSADLIVRFAQGKKRTGSSSF